MEEAVGSGGEDPRLLPKLTGFFTNGLLQYSHSVIQRLQSGEEVRSLQTSADVSSAMTASESLSPWETVELGHGLSLVPRILVNFTFSRVDQSLRTVDEWQLKECLKALVHKSISFPCADSDLTVCKERQAYKRKRNEPVATAVLHIWLSDQHGASVSPEQKKQQVEDMCREKLNSLEVNVAGLKLRCHAEIMESYPAESLLKSWEGNRDFRTGNAGGRPDTLVVKGIPSLWLSEPRVSSKASILVTHTIFSTFGGVRNVEVTSDRGGDIEGKQLPLSLAPTLRCDVWVQFNKHSSLFKALEAFCGRALAKEGTSLRTDCSAELDVTSYFSEQSVRKRKFEKQSQEEMERRELANKVRLANLEARKAALLEHQKRQAEEAERALREEEEKRRQAEEDAKAKEEAHLLELQRVQAEAEERRIREEEQLAQKIREEEERQQLELEERKRIEQLEAKRAKEEEEERRLVAQRKEDARRLAAQDDIEKSEARRLILEREKQRRSEERARQAGLHSSGYTHEVEELDRWILEDSGSIDLDTKRYLAVSHAPGSADSTNSTAQLRRRLSSKVVRV